MSSFMSLCWLDRIFKVWMKRWDIIYCQKDRRNEGEMVYLTFLSSFGRMYVMRYKFKNFGQIGYIYKKITNYKLQKRRGHEGFPSHQKRFVRDECTALFASVYYSFSNTYNAFCGRFCTWPVSLAWNFFKIYLFQVYCYSYNFDSMVFCL